MLCLDIQKMYVKAKVKVKAKVDIQKMYVKAKVDIQKMYVKAKVKVKAKVEDKVSQLMVKKLNKPITSSQPHKS